MMVTAEHTPSLSLVGLNGMETHSSAYSAWLRSWGASEATIDTRMCTVRALERARVDAVTVTVDALTDWIAAQGWSGWTLTTYHSSLRSIFGWLHDSGRRADNPMSELRKPRTPKSLPRPLTRDQASDLLTDAGPKVRAYLILALYAGLRAHEIAKIEGADVTREWLYVDGKGGQQAHVPTHPLVWELARSMPATGPWFRSPNGGHVGRSTVSQAVGRHMRKHGLTGSIHRARHSYATTLLRSGVNIRVVQTLMRHESITSTQAYTAVDDDERTSAIAGLDFAA